MTWVITGLGNPDEEHIHTRHNAGRMALEYFAKQKKLGDWKDDPGTTTRKRVGYGAGKKSLAFVTRGMVGKSLVVGVLPNTYMNKSGNAIAHYIKSTKAAEKLIVLYDDLDLPLGRIKISFDRGSGGHNGVESVIRAVKTRAFTRIRIGISLTTPSGVTKKPEGEKNVERFILGEFKSTELAALKATFKRVSEAIDTLLTESREKAMSEFN